MSADSANKSWKDTPYLYDLKPESWKEFEKLYKAYRARGGTRDLVSLIDPDLHELIKIQLDDDEQFDSSDERSTKLLLEEINKWYAPSTFEQSMELLRGIKYGDEGKTKHRVVQLVHDFNVALKGMSTKVKPAPRILIKMLVNKVKPRSIREHTFNDLELVEGADTNYKFAVKTLIEYAKEHDEHSAVTPTSKKDTATDDEKKDTNGKNLSETTCRDGENKGQYKGYQKYPNHDPSKGTQNNNNNRIVEESNSFIEVDDESIPKIKVNIEDVEMAAIIDSGCTLPSMSQSIFDKVKHLVLSSKDVNIQINTPGGSMMIDELKTFKANFKDYSGKIQQEILDFAVIPTQYHDLSLPHMINKKHNLYATEQFKKAIESTSYAITKNNNTVGVSSEDCQSKRIRVKKLMTISKSKENNSIT